MSSHLSDEAVAAFADGVLRGPARARATRHVETCVECRQAVRSQREAVFALRAAPTPSLPAGLFERLQALPDVTPVTTLPTVIAEDGSMMLAAHVAPVAAFIPPAPVPAKRRGPAGDSHEQQRQGGHDSHAKSRASRAHPFVTGVAVVALTAGVLAVSSVTQSDDVTAGVTQGTDSPAQVATDSTRHAATGSTGHEPSMPPAFVSALSARR